MWGAVLGSRKGLHGATFQGLMGSVAFAPCFQNSTCGSGCRSFIQSKLNSKSEFQS